LRNAKYPEEGQTPHMAVDPKMMDVDGDWGVISSINLFPSLE
jgi:hypothetical protein